MAPKTEDRRPPDLGHSHRFWYYVSPSFINTRLFVLWLISNSLRYSGIAWKFGDRELESIQTVTDWTTVRNYRIDAPEAPSAIFYGDNVNRDLTWGYMTPFGDGILRWFKLLLVNERDPPENVRDCEHLKSARDLMHKLNKTPVQIFSDYLRNIWEYSRERIEAAEEKGWTNIY